MKTRICGGTIVTEKEAFRGDLLIEDGRILEITRQDSGANPEADGAEVIDASGKLVLPGAVDIHTHMDLDVGIARAIDDFYSGTVAAACGGTTTIVDHMAFGPKGCSPWHQVKEYHRLADGNAVVDYGFHGVLQHVNGEVLDEMAQIAETEGITSFKVYMTYDFRLDDLDLMRVLERAGREHILIASHCENHGIVTCLRERFVKEGKTQTRSAGRRRQRPKRSAGCFTWRRRREKRRCISFIFPPAGDWRNSGRQRLPARRISGRRPARSTCCWMRSCTTIRRKA